MKPRWRYDWKCNWFYRRADGMFQAWMAPHWTINAFSKRSQECHVEPTA